MLGRHDVGHRVVIRRNAGEHDNRPLLSDVLGKLTEFSETQVTVATRHGIVVLDQASIVTAKRVPDQRRRTATEALEAVAAAGWPAPHTELLGDWLLRAADGWTSRGNSALAIGEPGRPLAEAVDAVERWYAARGALPAITVPEPVGGRVARELADRGWTPAPATLVRTAAIQALRLERNVANAPTIQLDEVPSAAWLAIVAGRKGALPAAALHVLTAVPTTRFACYYAPGGADSAQTAGLASSLLAPGGTDSAQTAGLASSLLAPGGTALAIGRGVVAGDRRWLGLSLVEVAPSARRRGLARAVVGALADWAAALGATRVYLQVEERNTEAGALYDALGFDVHHRYATWRPSTN